MSKKEEVESKEIMEVSNLVESLDVSELTPQKMAQCITEAYPTIISEGKTMSKDATKLAKRIFIKSEEALYEAEARRQNDKYALQNRPSFTWNNVDLVKFVKDSLHRVNLGLDAFLDNHIHPIPYFNTRKGKYDLVLMTGYRGIEYYKRKLALNPPKDIRYELICSNDKFKVIKKDHNNEVEGYTLEYPDDPLNGRGEVRGGIAYLIYDDPSKNKVILVSKDELDKFDKDKGSGNKKSSDDAFGGGAHFWKHHKEAMYLKTIIRKACNQLEMDPEKEALVSYREIEKEDLEHSDSHLRDEDRKREIEESANKKELDFDEETGEIEGEEPDTEDFPEGELVEQEIEMPEGKAPPKKVKPNW